MNSLVEAAGKAMRKAMAFYWKPAATAMPMPAMETSGPSWFGAVKQCPHPSMRRPARIRGAA